MRNALLTLAAVLVAGMISLGFSGGVIAAAPITPGMEGMPGMGGDHPAHIHSGTCATLGDVVHPLSDVSAQAMNNGTPMAMMDMMMGSGAAIPVESSVTTVQAALSDIVGGEHAINVHESADNIGNYIACGDIGGAMVGENSLLFGLAPLNDSGYSGIGSLVDNGDGTTTVYVYLMNSSMMGWRRRWQLRMPNSVSPSFQAGARSQAPAFSCPARRASALSETFL